MKYNKIVNESDIKNKNTFLVACVCSIVLLLTMCYFGVNSNIKGTAAATTCDGKEIDGYCCPDGYTNGVTSDGLCYNNKYYRSENKCIIDSQTSLTDTSAESYTQRGYECVEINPGTSYATWSCTLYGDDLSTCTAQGTVYDDGSEAIEQITGDNCDKVVSFTTYDSCESKFGSNWSTVSKTSYDYESIYSGFFELKCHNTSCDSKCWQCTSNSSLFSWGVSADSSLTCSGGWVPMTSISEENCVTITYKSVTCPATEYYDSTIDGCTQCKAGKYCPGGTFSVNPNNKVTQGSFVCPTGTTSNAGSDSKDDCYSTSSDIVVTGTFYTADANNALKVHATTKCTLNSENKCTLPMPSNPSLSGWTFKGWSKGAGCSGFNETTFEVSADTNYYACYVQNGYDDSTIVVGTFYNGDDVYATKTCQYSTGESECSMPIPTAPSKDGYTFNGWGSSKSCTSGSTSAFDVTENVTRYACWQKVSTGTGGGGSTTTTYTYKATFNANGGTLNGSSSKSCTTTGSSCSVSDLPTASKDGYTFKGWGTSSSCTSGKTDRLTLSEHTTFYACYTNNSNNNNNTNVEDNPDTGEITMALVWFAGLFAIAYSVYYFKQVREN